MAYVVARRNSTWELRESYTTAAGPRSRTLAGFRTLTPEVIERARGRAQHRLSEEDCTRAAMRAGAPVALGQPDRAARELLSELAGGGRLRPALANLLARALSDGGESLPGVVSWIGASPADRAAALRDLLLLTDRLPPVAPREARFPRLSSAPA